MAVVARGAATVVVATVVVMVEAVMGVDSVAEVRVGGLEAAG